MRVTVDVFGLGEERSGGGEFLEDAQIGGRRAFRGEILDGFEGGQADEVGGHLAIGEVFAVVTHRAVDRQLVFEAGDIVLRAMARRGVDAAGAAVGGDVVGQYDGGGPVNERMAGLQMFQLGAGQRKHDGGLGLDSCR